MMQIDNSTYKVNEINHYKTNSVKTQIVIALSLRKNDHHITRLSHKDFGKTKKWNTYTVSRNGKIYQHYDDKLHSDFLGIKVIDRQSISIVLENMGYLFETNNGEFVNWLNEKCDTNHVVEKSLLGYDYWENIPKLQMKSVKRAQSSKV